MSTPADEGIAAAIADARGERSIIGSFAIGDAAFYQDAGAVCVQHVSDRLFRVFVAGGVLPDGDDERNFANATLAFEFAAGVVALLAAEYADFVDAYGVQP